MKNNITSILDFSPAEMERIFRIADLKEEIFPRYSDSLKGKALASIFFQPSTRTRLSFEAAFQKLGGTCIGFTDIQHSRCGSSYEESMTDFARTISRYCDLIVMRTGSDEDFQAFISAASKPVISAGSSFIEHPTQALIDIYTISKRVPFEKELSILICGNLKERTINSLVLGLTSWTKTSINFVCPKDCKLDLNIESKLTNKDINIEYYDSYSQFCESKNSQLIEVIYQEVIDNEHTSSNCNNHHQFYLDPDVLLRFKKKPIILHPFPRGKELPESLDRLPNSVYFDQITNGQYIRAALLYFMLVDRHKMEDKFINTKPPIYYESNARNYSRSFPANFVWADGCNLRDDKGKKYIDMLQCAGANILGHNEKNINELIISSLNSNSLQNCLDLNTPDRTTLIDYLFKSLPENFSKNSKIQFCSPSGADGIEAAIKLFYLYTKRKNVLTFSGSYHGMTMFALSSSDNSKLKLRIGTTNENNHIILPFIDEFCEPEEISESLLLIERQFSSAKEQIPALVILELVQGEGGVRLASKEWVKGIRNLCSQYLVPLVIDEVQTGIGRTGAFCAFQLMGITPDAIILSKGLGGGFPISVLIYREKYDSWAQGDHAGTNRGFQPAFVAGTEVLSQILHSSLLSNVHTVGAYFREKLNRISKDFSFVGRIRQVGLMLGIEVIEPPENNLSYTPSPKLAQEIKKNCYDLGLIIETGGVWSNTLRLLPPLNVTLETVETVLSILKKSFIQIKKNYTNEFDSQRSS